MKTLDEVIAGMTELILSGKTADVKSVLTDARSYLKEYKEKHDDILRMEEALGYCEISDNPPLTWEQLKVMEGSPVWVETKYYSSRWAVITDVDDVRIRFVGKQLLDSEIVQEMGESWQAYRKERK